ncbi:MAG: hypothetical protein GEEBNDBF_01202 [bacterium]|nr:hypothetical protein [bacterium]
MPAASTSAVTAELFAVLSRSYAALSAGQGSILREYGLSLPKYQVLRILKDAGGRLPAGHIAGQMAFRSSDLTRLLDGLEKAGAVERTRGKDDRRVVQVKLTSEGNRMLRQVEGPLDRWLKSAFSALSATECRQLEKLLLRCGGEAPD